MTNESGKAPTGASGQDNDTQDLRIEDLGEKEGAQEQADSLRGGVINRGAGQPTYILADTWTGLTADADKDLA